MKKLTAFLLIALLCITSISVTGCKDPLKEKGEELDATYAELGQAYYDATYWASLAGVYGSEDEEYADINSKFAEWKIECQDAGDVVDGWLDLDEEEMNSYIDEWKAAIADMQVVIDQYKIVEETTAEETTVAE